jgi:hypothetical protein
MGRNLRKTAPILPMSRWSPSWREIQNNRGNSDSAAVVDTRRDTGPLGVAEASRPASSRRARASRAARSESPVIRAASPRAISPHPSHRVDGCRLAQFTAGESLVDRALDSNMGGSFTLQIAAPSVGVQVLGQGSLDIAWPGHRFQDCSGDVRRTPDPLCAERCRDSPHRHPTRRSEPGSGSV